MAVSRLILVYLTLAAWYMSMISILALGGAIFLKDVTSGLQTLVMRQSASSDGRTTKTVHRAVSDICAFVLGVVFGSRVGALAKKLLQQQLSLINAIVCCLYLLGTAFVFSASLLLDSLDLQLENACSTAIYCCLIFYFLSKCLLQSFLVERLHTICAHRNSRLRDPIWTTFVLIIMMGFGSIMILAFIRPIAQVSAIDGICRIGLPTYLALPMLLYEILVNTALTGVFVYSLRTIAQRSKLPISPIVVHRRISIDSLPSQTDEGGANEGIRSVKTVIERGTASVPGAASLRHDSSFMKRGKWTDGLITRSTLGAVLVLMPTIVNLASLYHVHGREQGWICFTFCTADGMCDIDVPRY
ncbi:hypothetical protein ANO11243_048910 [Dothideomycetidae sp. 11243]|nr:hypothetical protein ANO11243_048910 [fungal sp. No.11243]